MDLPEADEVHLWRIDLAVAADNLDVLGQTLSLDEVARAERLRIPLARARFVAARGMLRAILARYGEVAPAALRFRYGPAGKPQIDESLGTGIEFNLAHSHDLALLAVAREIRVGVDVELIGDADYTVIARNFFAPVEQRDLDALPSAQRRAAFYHCWVCKEAFVKARGAGLALSQFAVSVAPDTPAELRYVDADLDEAGRWRISAMRPALGFVAALCVEARAGDSLRISYRPWEPSRSTT